MSLSPVSLISTNTSQLKSCLVMIFENLAQHFLASLLVCVRIVIQQSHHRLYATVRTSHSLSHTWDVFLHSNILYVHVLYNICHLNYHQNSVHTYLFCCKLCPQLCQKIRKCTEGQLLRCWYWLWCLNSSLLEKKKTATSGFIYSCLL